MIDLKPVAIAHRPYGLNCKCGLDINSDEHWANHFEQEVEKAQQEADLKRVRMPSRSPQTPAQWNSYLKNRGLIPW